MPKVTGKKPKLTNRGPAGLLGKIRSNNQPSLSFHTNDLGRPNNIRCPGERVPVADLNPDPMNARVHGERNMEAIRESLKMYGQLKPLVVKRRGMVVMAGNGTLEAARQLGWTEVACNVLEMSPVEAAGFGLVDNRSAELARWDFAVVAQIDRLLQEANQAPAGWTADELEVLRMADWSPPEVDESAQFGSNGEAGGDTQSLVIGFTPDQMETVRQAMDGYRRLAGEPDLSDDDALEAICKRWLETEDRLLNPT